jgi:hypothetical protein
MTSAYSTIGSGEVGVAMRAWEFFPGEERRGIAPGLWTGFFWVPRMSQIIDVGKPAADEGESRFHASAFKWEIRCYLTPVSLFVRPAYFLYDNAWLAQSGSSHRKVTLDGHGWGMEGGISAEVDVPHFMLRFTLGGRRTATPVLRPHTADPSADAQILSSSARMTCLYVGVETAILLP